MHSNNNTSVWQGCYDQGWGKNLCPEAYSHPAKVSFKLAERIYAHAIENHWIEKNGTVLDPFGGICGFGFHAMVYGLNFIAVELEEKFVKLGEQNINLWGEQLRGWPNLGTARIVQGDSRRLKDVIRREFESCEGLPLIVSSPPFMAAQDGGGINKKGYTSRPDLGPDWVGDRTYNKSMAGHSPGQLSSMKEGFNPCVNRLGEIACVISSPPYEEMPIQQTHMTSNQRGDPKNPNYRPSWKKKLSEGYADTKRPYGHSPGQLGSMKEGKFEMVVLSPPYDEGLGHGMRKVRPIDVKKKLHMSGGILSYGESEGQLAGDNTFWPASREILQQCFDLLKSGGHAIWVCKDYVKNKQRVPFSDRWLALCESVGFKLVCRHQAMLKKDYGQINWVNDQIKLIKERKSFFRRNTEDKTAASKFWFKINAEIQNEYIEKARIIVTCKPTEKKIIQKAQILLWKDFLKPVEEIETRIDNEDILCFGKT